MFEKLILYSPIIIILLINILKFLGLRFSILIDELIYGSQIKKFSHILFWSIVSYIYWVCYHYQVSLFQIDSNSLDLVSLLSLVLTIWASYGVYVGFLQFMAGYDNKEKGTYLGYQKMDFLTKSNVWYHLTNSWEFFCSLLLSILIPLLIKLNILVGVRYQYIWQAIVGFLLILFVFLLKFSLKVARITIFINKKTDVGLKEVIESDIENRYNRYFKRLIKQKFSAGAREIYFSQVKIDLSHIDNKIDKINFLKLIYSTVSSKDFVSNARSFEILDIVNYKYFIKEKYDLFSNLDLEDDTLISAAISFFKRDVLIFDQLIAHDKNWVESSYNYDYANSFDVVDIPEVNLKINIKSHNNYPISYWEINNIHIYMFKKLANLAKNNQSITQLVKLIQDRLFLDIARPPYWKTNGLDNLFILEKSISDTSLKISKDNCRRIEKMDLYVSSEYPKVKSHFDDNVLCLSLHSQINKIDFRFKDGEQYFIERNETRDYYDDYEKKVWNVLFDKYRDLDNLSDAFLPNLSEPKVKLNFFGDYDNKISYSQICFNYLTNQFEYINSSNSQFENLVGIVNTMSTTYRGAFALYQLLYPENRDWDSSIETYKRLLSAALPSEVGEKEKVYNDMVSIIVKYGNSLGEKVLRKVFETSDVKQIDNEFFKDFESIHKMKLILVQSILSTNPWGFRKVELQGKWEKQDLVVQYIRALSITPNIFPSHNYDYKTLNLTMNEFLFNNLELLTSYNFANLPLSSILLFEELLCTKYRQDNYVQKLMIDLIEEKDEQEPSGYRYIIYASLLKFFTLKLTEGHGEEYLILSNKKSFKKAYKFSLLYHLKTNHLTLDMYLDGIADELKDYEIIKIGIYEKELIKREIEKIIFKNYYISNKKFH